MEELLAEIRRQWGKPAHCRNCDKESDLHSCASCATVYCGIQCQKLMDKCLIGVKTRTAVKRPRDEGEGDDEDAIVLPEDMLYIVMQFLNANDLKNASLASTSMTQLARRELVNRYRWEYSPDIMAKIRPKLVDVEEEDYGEFINDPNFENVTDVYYHDVVGNFKVPKNIKSICCFGTNFIVGDNIDLSHNLSLVYLEISVESGWNGTLLLPPSVQSLILPHSFNRPIILPSSLTYLGFDDTFDPSIFNQPLVLPNTLKKLHLSARFNQPVILPEGLKTFNMGENFNHPLILPKSITNLEMGNNFNHPLLLHEGLVSVTFGRLFNRPVVCPRSLTYLTLGRVFSRHVDLSNIITLTVHNPIFEHMFPNTLHTLYITKEYISNFGVKIIPSEEIVRHTTTIRIL